MVNAVTVRPARDRDIDELCKLYSEFHEFHVKGVPDRLRRPSTYDGEELRLKLAEIIEAERSAILVAELLGQVIGLAELYLREDEPNPYRVTYTYVHLQSMLVNEKYRRQRVGRRLMHAVEKWAKERSASEIRLNVWEFETGPLKFYEKQGYYTVRRMMVRKLS